MLFSLDVLGGSPLLLVQNTGGMATLLRAALAEIAAVPTGSVAIRRVNATVSSSTNSSDLVSNSSYVMNTTSGGNEGVNTSGLAYFTGGKGARRLSGAAADDPLCAAVRQTGAVNNTVLGVELAIDVADLLLSVPSNTDPATFLAERLRRLLNSTNLPANSGLASFANVWSNCTGAPSDLSVLVAVRDPPAVLSLTGYVGQPTGPTGSTTAAQDDDNSAVVGGAVGGTLGALAFCCCLYFLLVTWRRRKQAERKQQPVVATATVAPSAATADPQAFSLANPMVAEQAQQQAAKKPRFMAMPSITVQK